MIIISSVIVSVEWQLLILTASTAYHFHMRNVPKKKQPYLTLRNQAISENEEQVFCKTNDS